MGVIVPRDYEEAVKWYLRSANKGDADGQYRLGVMFYRGDGVEKSNIEAHKWWNLAASHGSRAAGTMRDMIARRMTPQEIAEAQRLARSWVPSR